MSLLKEIVILPLTKKFWVPFIIYGVSFFVIDRILEVLGLHPTSMAMEAIWLMAYLHGLSDLLEARHFSR